MLPGCDGSERISGTFCIRPRSSGFRVCGEFLVSSTPIEVSMGVSSGGGGTSGGGNWKDIRNWY